MMEDMTHVQMSLAYTLRHLTSVLRVLSAMLSKYMREIKILGMDDDGHLLVFLHNGENSVEKVSFCQIFKLVYVIFSLLSQKDYWKKISLSMSPLSVRKQLFPWMLKILLPSICECAWFIHIWLFVAPITAGRKRASIPFRLCFRGGCSAKLSSSRDLAKAFTWMHLTMLATLLCSAAEQDKK